MERAALHLKKSPLILVIAQAKTTPVLEMEQYVPKIQERLRHEGYPRFKTSLINEVLLGPTPSFRSAKKWIFADKENTTAVAIAPNFIVLETAAYQTFEGFTANLQKVLEVFGEVVEPALCERLGLRYVNLVRPGQDESISHYLQPTLLGLDEEKLGLKSVRMAFRLRSTSSVGNFALRLTRSETGSLLPPDLDDPDVTLQIEPFRGPRAILDLDHFSQESKEYQPADLIKLLWSLHAKLEDAFQHAVTAHALKRWRGDE